MDGLRVHGRLNINAAPWKALAGLPLMPAKVFEGYPRDLRDKIVAYSQMNAQSPNVGTPIGPELAKAIVAYRDLRQLDDGDDADGQPIVTGFYGSQPGTAAGWHGWDHPAPNARRGTGFMSVGELLNVRHPLAYEKRYSEQPLEEFYDFDDYSSYRMDSGVVLSRNDQAPADDTGVSTEDYVSAISLMVALGDWVTVRSEVFTIYGVIRGVEDLTIEDPDPETELLRRLLDIDARAIRFQETVDRLPTFLGERLPTRIGERVLGRYTDVQGD